MKCPYFGGLQKDGRKTHVICENSRLLHADANEPDKTFFTTEHCLSENRQSPLGCRAFLITSIKNKKVNVGSNHAISELQKIYHRVKDRKSCEGCEFYWWSAGYKNAATPSEISGFEGWKEWQSRLIPCECLTHYCRPCYDELYEITDEEPVFCIRPTAINEEVITDMNPHIFPECEGCEAHRYTYDNKFIKYLEGQNEMETRIAVEPNTHYCSLVGGVYRKLNASYRPLGCLRASNTTTQEVNQLSTDMIPSPVATGVLADHRDLNIITAEIQFYNRQAGESLLEVGKRLIEAKEQLAHGEWLGWLSQSVGYSDATAQRIMRITREYDNPALVTELGVSKALTLLALPPAEREDFMEEVHEVDGEEKSVSDMSKRELEKAVRERAEAIRQKEEAEAAAENARRVAEESAAAMAAADERAAAARAELERLQAEKDELSGALEQVRNAEPTLPEEEGQQTLEALRKEAAKEAKKAAEEKLKKKIEDADRAKSEADQKVNDAQAERDRVRQAAEREQAAAVERITALEKKLAAASSETVTVFKTHFENVQGPINAMLGCLLKLKDAPETQVKLTNALRALCEKTLAGLPASVLTTEDNGHEE